MLNPKNECNAKNKKLAGSLLQEPASFGQVGKTDLKIKELY